MAGADILMGQTLPTIIGMGVVSQTTQSLFGGDSRGGPKRRPSTKTAETAKTKQAKSRTKIFNGKRYSAANWHPSKSASQKDAGYFRSSGHAARVVREQNLFTGQWGYTVYVR
uniref:Uncharacterized protein n=1 Tax=viral metagenome TaxID=1070528 RepID=A0A6M3Y1J0_9ZZZZ